MSSSWNPALTEMGVGAYQAALAGSAGKVASCRMRRYRDSSPRLYDGSIHTMHKLTAFNDMWTTIDGTIR